MMPISNLKHDDLGIRCACCGHRWEASRQQLSDPEGLLASKERIAEKHTCRPVRTAATVRVLKFPTGVDLDRYWAGETRRLEAQMAMR